MLTESVRSAKLEELPHIADIERAAGVLFANAGMPEIAAHPPTPLQDLKTHLDDDTLLVATDHNTLVGFATLTTHAQSAHLDEMAVHPQYGRRGHGTRLLEAACALAQRRGHTAITLTTFKHLAWNAPYYAKRGFRTLTESELTDELHRLRAHEATYGLDPNLRVVMRRELDATQNSIGKTLGP